MSLGVPYNVAGISSSGSQTTVATVRVNTTPGDAIKVWVTTNANSFTSVTDSQNNTYNALGNSVTNGTLKGQWYVALNTVPLQALTSTITLTRSASNGAATLSAFGCSGVLTSSAFDVSPTSATGTSTAPSIASGTLSQASELVCAGLVTASGAGAVMWSSPFLAGAQDVEQFGANEIGESSCLVVASTASVTASGTLGTSQNWGMALISLKAAPPVVGFNEAAVDTLFDKVQSHALTLGYFDAVNTHEPKRAPGNGMTCAIWVQNISPLGGASGLVSASGLVTLNIRIYTNMLQEPQDAIDPNMVKATTTLLAAYAGDFDLGQTVRNVDLFGQSGTRLNAQAGYIPIDNRLYRAVTITLPVIVNDMWPEAG